MSREIRFRAWVGNKMLADVGIIPFLNEGSVYQDQYGSFFLRGDNNNLMQYTGLKDKNDKEIYEGDIVECEQLQDLGKFKGVVHSSDGERHYGGENSPIIYDPRIYLDTSAFGNGVSNNKHMIFHKNPEVIGNIHENPELING